MKPVQWIIALVVLAAMVFLITFAMNFLGEENSSSKKSSTSDDQDQEAGDALLTFSAPSYRGLGGPYHEQEKNQAGQHDFLFSNQTSEDVAIGLNSLGCSQCTSVEVLLAPNEAKTNL